MTRRCQISVVKKKLKAHLAIYTLLVATGFLTVGLRIDINQNPTQNRNLDLAFLYKF